LFLGAGQTVYCVEPNADMRAAAERQLSRYAGLRSIDGSAEQTTLADGSIDMVVAAQAFHWFDKPAARREFARILRPGGKVLLMWNQRRTSGTPFLEGYEQLLNRFGTDYGQVRQANIEPGVIEAFFGAAPRKVVLVNQQVFDFDALRGRLLSSSYTPLPGQPGHDELLAGLRGLFDRCCIDGKVAFSYDTELYFGPIV
jgi:SAM-dependent methyltransferase